jgi:flagellar motor switch protein FliN/FliY
VITDTPTSLTGLLATAAASVARTLAVGEPITAGEITPGPVEVPFQQAVLVALGGAVSGELAVFVDDELATAVRTAPIGQLDLAAALASTIEDLTRSLGPVVVGVPQVVDGRLAQSRLAAHAEPGTVPLYGAVELRAAVSIGLDPAPVAQPVAGPPSLERLDLLRGVEMAATAELGRARMTINDLLSLRDGAIIELDRAAGEAADLFVNGRLIARGEVVVVDENYALRITQIVPDEVR